ncbi:MAG: imidazoleglycerol-phosphate dehydratase HisB [Bacillota bacterium]
MTRKAKVNRITAETEISLEIKLDGRGKAVLKTGLPFFDHMLDLLCRHGFFDLNLEAKGDLEVDGHHLVEDVGICLGRAWHEAIGNKKGIKRYGFSIVPMDEALITAAADLSGRPYLYYDFSLPAGLVGTMDTELFREFWQAFVNEGRLNLHLMMNHGLNKHHIIEASFKAAGKSLNEASSRIENFDEVLSTKGNLE